MLLNKTDMMSILITNTIHIDTFFYYGILEESYIERCDILYYIFPIVSEIKFSFKKN